jgi:hypothetical protein
MIGLFYLFFNSGEVLYFFIQGAGIKLISSLVNKKARVDHLKALKKFDIAKPELSWGKAVP